MYIPNYNGQRKLADIMAEDFLFKRFLDFLQKKTLPFSLYYESRFCQEFELNRVEMIFL